MPILQRIEMKRSRAPGAAKRVDKGLRALRKGVVHLVTPQGEKQQFKDETRAEFATRIESDRTKPLFKKLRSNDCRRGACSY